MAVGRDAVQGGDVGPGGFIFVEIPVRSLQRAADFYAALFGWSFEVDDEAESWNFTPGRGGPMGRITMRRAAHGQGVLVFVAVDDVNATISRAIELGGGTSEPTTRIDVGEYAVFTDPDGTRIGLFHSHLAGRRQPGGLPGTSQRDED
jgi:hypothetical protein